MGREFSPVHSVFASLLSGISCRRILGEALGAESGGAKLGEKLLQGGDVQQKLWQKAEKLFSWINRKREIC